MTERVFWIGSIMPEEHYRELCNLGYQNQQASRIAQMNIVSGLQKYYGCKFCFISGPALPAYPKFKELRPKEFVWEEGNSKGICVGYTNIEYLNRELKGKALVRAAKRFVQECDKDEEIAIYVNSPHTPFIKCGLYLKKRFPQAKLIMVVPDLPQYMELKTNSVKAFLKKIDYGRIEKSLPKFDGFVLYSRHMAEALKLDVKKTVVMEGCAQGDTIAYAKDRAQTFTFMYSGKVDHRFGMELMVKAFGQIEDENCRLVITGTGDASEYVCEAARKDERISYHGFVEDYETVKKLQVDADVMLNMRLPSEPASMYCFPSKLFEYMKTGNPVISFRIGGIPEEYYPHLLLAEKEDAQCLLETMKKAMQMTAQERADFGQTAQAFILSEKNVDRQTKKIYDFAMSL